MNCSDLTVHFSFQAIQENLFSLPDRWNLAFTDLHYNKFFQQIQINELITILTLNEEMCCSLLKNPSCTCSQNFVLQEHFLYDTVRLISDIIKKLSSENYLLQDIACNASSAIQATNTIERYDDLLDKMLRNEWNILKSDGSLRLKVRGSVEVVSNNSETVTVATYTDGIGFIFEGGRNILPSKRFYRIGVTEVKMTLTFTSCNNSRKNKTWFPS